MRLRDSWVPAYGAGAPPLEEVGCLAYIAQHSELPDGRFLLWLVGLEPFRIEQELEVETPYRAVRGGLDPTAHDLPCASFPACP